MLNCTYKILNSNELVNSRIYYYILDAINTNNINVSNILNVEFKKLNFLTKEQIYYLFEYIIKLEL